MQKKIFFGCLAISLMLTVGGLAWHLIDGDNAAASHLFTAGWLSLLLVAAYYVTPSGTTFGKIAFAASVILVIGIAMKVFEMAHAEKIIIGSIFTLGFTYMKMWMKAKKDT